MLVWILWFTISIGPNVVMHIPVEEEFHSLDACVKAAETYWAPLLKQQFPDDRKLMIQCLPETAEKVNI